MQTPVQPPAPAAQTAVQLFEQQVARTPQALALVDGDRDRTYTYQDLNARANQLAHYLQALGVQAEELVAVSMDRSVHLIVAFLGILKAGAAYVPLDPTYPHERRAYKLRDAQVHTILTQTTLVSSLPEYSAKVICVDGDWGTIAQQLSSNLNLPSRADSLAYVLYTSGSTGNPKGVMIEHRGLANHATAIAQEFGITATDRMLQFSNIGFDIIVEELYPTLISGATLVLRPEAIASSTQAFWQFVDAQKITILDLPTAFWHELVNGLVTLNQTIPATVRLVCVGGEKASRQSYQQWRSIVPNQVRWINTYGPTETTVTATWFDPVRAGFDPESGDIPIGQALPNVTTYLLDPQQQSVAIGEPGELYIGGPGLARGYLNMPERTADRFINHGQYGRLYRTGDQVQQRPDGDLEFVGRLDFQVKIRGFRIELCEIDTRLEQLPEVQQGVVIAKDRSGVKYLVAYVVPSQGQNPDPKDLIQGLRQHLPNYMIPSQWVLLDRLPLTPNGKVDRAALPEPTIAEPPQDLEPPKDALEGELVHLWSELLGQSVAVTDNFFELGGHSLLVARLCDRIEHQLGQRISPMVLFQHPTLRQLSQYLRQGGQESDDTSCAVVIQAGSGKRPPLFAIHVLGEGARFFRPLGKHLGSDWSIYGLSAQLMNREAPKNRVEDLAAYYITEMRRLQPEGPYHLTGMSYGGTIAYEMARQLEQQGLSVGLLGLLDTYGPNAETLPSKDRVVAHWQQFQDQGLAYLGQKVLGFLADRREHLVIAYGRAAIAAGLKVSYELQYKVVLADNLAADALYVPQAYGGRLSLFRATAELFYSQRYLDEGLGWRSLVGQLDIYDIPGSHMAMVEEPHARTLAESLERAIGSSR
ncbi:MAG: amino acid adenylation domain-containing protein [Alkalinema sp. RU_4_3]|nr:amino acid adenylation domain-containing protein [Alkalinema sp. RU_4_3]